MSNANHRNLEEQAPAFNTREGCKTWLESQPVANAVQTQNLLQRQLSLLNLAKVNAPERLSILEVLRAPICEVQDECVKRYVGRPLPLAPPEQIALESTLTLWRTLHTGYLRCLKALLSGEVAIQPQAALLLQRLLSTLTHTLIDSLRGNLAPDTSFWQNLHQFYIAAEELKVLDKPVSDPLRRGRESVTPGDCYAEALLINAAALHELRAREQEWAIRWAQRWAPKLIVSNTEPEPSPAVPLRVDLSSDQAAAYIETQGKTPRFFDTTELRRSLKKRLVMLEKGAEPASIQLGDNCVLPDCELLLKQVYERWCKGGNKRRHKRHDAEGKCNLINGVEAIHQQLSGKREFKQPGEIDLNKIRKDREQLKAFDTVSMNTVSAAEAASNEPLALAEEWDMVDQSNAGLGISRSLKQGGKRIGSSQLVAVKPEDSRSYRLGAIRWVLVNDDDNLQAGVQLFPGEVIAVSLRNRNEGRGTGRYERAFMLPALPKLKVNASILIPLGWFQVGAKLDLFDGTQQEIMLTSLLERGQDFDRVSFV